MPVLLRVIVPVLVLVAGCSSVSVVDFDDPAVLLYRTRHYGLWEQPGRFFGTDKTLCQLQVAFFDDGRVIWRDCDGKTYKRAVVSPAIVASLAESIRSAVIEPGVDFAFWDREFIALPHEGIELAGPPPSLWSRDASKQWLPSHVNSTEAVVYMRYANMWLDSRNDIIRLTPKLGEGTQVHLTF